MVERFPGHPLVFATTWWEKLRGLCAKDVHGAVLVLAHCDDIHTFTMKEAIDLAFLDKRGKVIGVYRSVPPKRRIRCRHAVVAIERMASQEPWLIKGTFVCLSQM